MLDLSSQSIILTALVATSIAKIVFGAVTRKRRRQTMVKVGTVSQLNCYPVKSCRGLPIQEGVCTFLGLKTGKATDRHWMVVRSNGDFLTQRQISKMALITTDVHETELVINAPGMPTLTLPLCPMTDRAKVMKCRVWGVRFEGMDCGDDAAFWFSTFINIQGLRLLYSAPDIQHNDLTLTKKSWGNLAVPGDQAAFSDFAAYLVTSEKSLESLNESLKEKVTMNRFRPNIVISGCDAYDEDNWSELQIGESATLRMLDPCTRCVMVTVNPDTGERHPNSEPLKTLKSIRCFPDYGASPLFGINATLDIEGLVRVGDPVYAIRKSRAST